MPSWMHYAAPALFGVFLVAAALSDIVRRRIPNWAVLALLAVYVFAAVMKVAPASPWSALGAALIAFPVTYGFYHFDILGAGDAKLFTAAALFAGLKYLLPFALITTLIGGLIAIGFLLARPRRVMRGLTAAGRAQGGAMGIPYGVPIALAAAAVCYLNGFLNFAG